MNISISENELNDKEVNNLLNLMIEGDSINSEKLEPLLKKVREMKKRNEILKKYPIKQLPNDGKFYIRLEGKLIQRRKKKDLEDYIIKNVGVQYATMNSVFEDFLAYRKISKAYGTWSKDERYYNQFIKNSELANISLSEIKLSNLVDFFQYCKTVKPDMKVLYWRNLKGSISQFFEYCISEGLMENNPVGKLKINSDLLKPPTFKKETETVFSKEEQEKVICYAEKDAFESECALPLGIVVLFHLGLRNGELCALKWKDIHNGKIHVQREMIENGSKGRKRYMLVEHCKTRSGDRFLPLNSKMRKVFDQIRNYNCLKGYGTEDDDLIFQRTIKDKIYPVTPRSFEKRLEKYCKWSNMDYKSPHDVRRTCFTNLYNLGAPLKSISAFAGHSSIKQTMDYIRVQESEDIMSFLECLDEKEEIA